jgi:hypothetical protein
MGRGGAAARSSSRRGRRGGGGDEGWLGERHGAVTQTVAGAATTTAANGVAAGSHLVKNGEAKKAPVQS